MSVHRLPTKADQSQRRARLYAQAFRLLDRAQKILAESFKRMQAREKARNEYS